MKNERRIVSHAKNDKSIDKVVGKDGKKYSVLEACEKKSIGFKLTLVF